MSFANSVLIQNNDSAKIKIDKKKIKELVLDILANHSIESSEVSILFTDNAQIKELNSQYRGKDKATDVLSFPQEMDSDIEEVRMLGDVIISLEKIVEQAKDYGVTFNEELCRMLVHGVLHLLGYDHVNGGRQAGKMKRKEEEMLKLFS